MIIGKEVDLSSGQQNRSQVTDIASHSKNVLLDATKRDGDVSSAGRRTVHNIMNQTQSTKSPDHRSISNISELSNTVSKDPFSRVMLTFFYFCSTNNSADFSIVRIQASEVWDVVPRKLPSASSNAKSLPRMEQFRPLPTKAPCDDYFSTSRCLNEIIECKLLKLKNQSI